MDSSIAGGIVGERAAGNQYISRGRAGRKAAAVFIKTAGRAAVAGKSAVGDGDVAGVGGFLTLAIIGAFKIAIRVGSG